MKKISDACGGVFNASNGTITSPSFPELYPSNKHCVWEILARPQYRITLNFTHFDLEGSNVYHEECEYDWVEVFSSFEDDNPPKRIVFCGNRLPPLITSESNSMKLIFSSDNKYDITNFFKYNQNYCQDCNFSFCLFYF